MIFKKGCSSDLEILEIYEQINRKKICLTRATQRNGNTRYWKPKHNSTATSILTQDERKNVELIFKNHHWRERNITIRKESRLEKSQLRNRKGK